MRVLRSVHIVPLKQAYPLQREGTLLSPVDTFEYAAWPWPHLQIEDSIKGSDNGSMYKQLRQAKHMSSHPPITLYTLCV